MTWSGQLSWSARKFFLSKMYPCQDGDVVNVCSLYHFLSQPTQTHTLFLSASSGKWWLWCCCSSVPNSPQWPCAWRCWEAKRTAIILRMFICRPFPSDDQISATVRSRRWTPYLGCDAMMKRRDEGGTCRGTQEFHLSSWSHHLTHKQHSFMGDTDAAGSLEEADHCKGRILALPLGTKCSKKATWLRIYCHNFASGDRRRNLSATSWNLAIWESIGQTLSQMVCISIPRYWAL